MQEWTLSDQLIESYINRFFGHGNYKAKYWFIGMEFGGGNTVEEITRRISGWEKGGSPELEDLYEAALADGHSPWHGPGAKLQPTWRKLIRVLLTSEGLPATNEAIRAYQTKRLGSATGLDAIMELFPLPAPNLGEWLYYGQYSRLTYLANRAIYSAYVGPRRVARLRDLIADHRPPVVVFYGASYRYWWGQIAGLDLRPTGVEKVVAANNTHTLFVSIQHPASKGIRNTYFEEVGRLIRSWLASR